MKKEKLKYTGMVHDASGDYDSFRDAKNKERLIANATGKEKGAAGSGRGFVNPPTVAEKREERIRREVAEEMNDGRGDGPLLEGEKFAKGGKVKPRGWGAARYK